MYIFKKLFLWICLAVSFCVPNSFADKSTDYEINKAVHAAFHGKPIGLNNIKNVLADLMPKVTNIIAPKVDGEYKSLNEALKELNLGEQNLLVIRGQLQNL